jgi:putative tryptophan/tyrosine transport system substrate-binding protein
MRRRAFLGLLCLSAVSLRNAAAQQAERVRRIGVLMGIEQTDPDASPRAGAFQKRLETLGWIDGQNIRIEYRWLTPNASRLRQDAIELAQSRPDLLIADTTAALTALRPLSSDLPVIFLRVSDPVGAGFVNSLARPGGNITGITNFEDAIGSKWLELLKEIGPRLSQVVVLSYPGMVAHEGLRRAIENAAPRLGVKINSIPVRTTTEIDQALNTAAGSANTGVVLLPHAIIEINRLLIVDLAARLRLPVIYPLRHYASAGGLIAYGLEPHDLYSQVAVYVDRILRGAKPAELPVQQPTKFELAVNLKTAKNLGLEVSPKLLVLATEVIE